MVINMKITRCNLENMFLKVIKKYFRGTFWEGCGLGYIRASSSQLNNNCISRIWSNYFGILESIEGLKVAGEDLDGKLQILVNFSS